MAMRMSSTAAIQYVRRAAAHHYYPELAMPGPGYAALQNQTAAPWPTEVFNQLQRRAHERCTDWIAAARRHRSGLNGHEDVEHCRDSICASRSSPSLLPGVGHAWSGLCSTAKSKQPPLANRGFNQLQLRAHERRADWIRRARRDRSGLNGHEDPEHSPDSICASRRSPSLLAEVDGEEVIGHPFHPHHRNTLLAADHLAIRQGQRAFAVTG